MAAGTAAVLGFMAIVHCTSQGLAPMPKHSIDVALGDMQQMQPSQSDWRAAVLTYIMKGPPDAQSCATIASKLHNSWSVPNKTEDE